MSLTSHQEIRANEAIEMIKEVSKELTDVLGVGPRVTAVHVTALLSCGAS
jgi:hypothetical protein